MNKYIIRGSIAGINVTLFLSILISSFDRNTFVALLSVFMIGIFSFEFIICLICYHHALWNQDQTEQESQDGTK
jgi:hypothetical protein